MEEFNELLNEVQTHYDEYLQQTEKRGIPWGEIVYLQDLSDNELKELDEEITTELLKNGGVNNG